MKKYYFKVKYGFGALDFISIGPEELEKALYTHKYKVTAMIGGKQISGSMIQLIEPHYNKYTGWNETYQPQSQEDYAQIERDVPPELEFIIIEKREKIDWMVRNGHQMQIGKNIQFEQFPEKFINKLLTA